MKMERRKFLGFLGGAAAAGPKLAQSLASTVSTGGPPPMGVYAVAAGDSEGKWRLARIKELKGLLSGKDDETAKHRRMSRLYNVENVERFRLDSLRSVSATHKMQMFIEGNLDRQERIRRMHLEDELANLLKFVG